MAKKQLTIEEKLQAALVPAEEQPYKVPENWCWVRMGTVASLYRGVSYKKADAHSIKKENDCLIMRGGNIGEGYIDVDADNVYVSSELVNEEQLIKENDIVIVASTGSKKVIGRAGISFANYSNVAFGAFLMLVRPNGKTNARFIDYYFQSELYRNKIRNLAVGVNINNIRANYITELPIPFPTLNEQNRIVRCIESLFAKLDEATEKIQEVLDGAYLRRAAILHQAFTGKLTEKWRRENGVSDESWEEKKFSEVCEKITDGTHHSPENYTRGDFMYVTAKNIKEDGIDLSNITYVAKNLHEEIYARCDVKYGDVLYIKDGATTGIATVNDIKEPFSLLSSVAVLRPKNNLLLSEYMKYYLNSPETKAKMLNQMSGNAITRLTLKKIKSSKILVCEKLEQKEIVRLLDNLLTREQSIVTACEEALTTIDTLKKSILARAFRGELGTNDPSDPSAQKLLREILSA